jgi:DNA-binding Lrp family transcriptional regulator
MRQFALRPLDIPVALLLSERPEDTFQGIHASLGISASTAHDAVQRLQSAGIVYPHERKVNRHALLEFLEHGVRYAFPPMVAEGRVRGVPTAHAAPPLAGEIVSSEALVWPHPKGEATGESLLPLYDRAVELPERCPSIYEALTLVDALRAGRARERKLAAQKIREILSRPTMAA